MNLLACTVSFLLGGALVFWWDRAVAFPSLLADMHRHGYIERGPEWLRQCCREKRESA